MAKIIKMKDLIKESTWKTRKFGDPLPTMEDYKNAGFKMIFNTGGVNINNMLSCVFSFLLIPLLVISYNKFELLGELQVSMLFVILLILSSSIYFYYSFVSFHVFCHLNQLWRRGRRWI